VNVGTDHNTAAFAVGSVRRWWNDGGKDDYPAARRLLITADAGGSSGYRTRTWKTGLAALAEETGLEITCCHFPPGTSKWNKIEHPLFAHITMNKVFAIKKTPPGARRPTRTSRGWTLSSASEPGHRG